MKRSLKKVGILLIALVLVLNTAGCANTGPGGSTTTPSASGGDQNIGTATAIREDKSIINVTDWPCYIDPGVGSKGADIVAYTNMYDTLTFPNPDGSTSPLVAEKWETGDGGLSYTFFMRKDVTFHSGNIMKASDVKFSMDRLLTMGEGFAYVYSGLIASTEVVDEFTVKFNLTQPSGTLANLLIRLYILEEKLVLENIDPSGNYGEFGDYGKSWLMTNDAGSGPYRLKEMRVEEYLLMERHPEYWQGWEGKSEAPELVKYLGGVDATTCRTMMARGELDFSDDGQTPESKEALAKIDGLTRIFVPSSLTFNIMLNTKAAPTDDVHVRRAMAYALDYQSVIDNIYTDSLKSTGPIVGGLTAASLTEEDMPYQYNLDKAMEELKQSPYYEELMAGTMPFTLTYCTEGGARQEKLALLMQAGMKELGIDLEITGKPFAIMLTDASTIETTPNASFVVFNPPYLDGGGYLKARYHSSATGSWEQMEWLMDPEIDAMIDQANTIADETERNEMFKEISRKLVDICPTLWVVDLTTDLVYRSEYILGTPSIDRHRAGESFIFAMGYAEYFRDYRVK